MRLGLDIRALQRGLRDKGVGTYIRNLANGLLSADTKDEFVCYLFANQPWEGDLPLVHHQMKRIWRPSRHAWLWEHALWPLDVRGARIDAFISLASLSPDPAIGLPYYQLCPTIAVVYDLGVRQLVDDPYMAFFVGTPGYRIQERALARVTRVVTISNYVRMQLTQVLGIPAEKVTVIYPAVDDNFHSHAGDVDAMIEKYGIGDRPFLLALGEGRNKNLVAIVRALAALQPSPLLLVVVAERDRWPETWLTEIDELNLSDRVLFTGYIPAGDLAGLYRGAEAFVFPSQFEGFGLPPLEAMACGCPVICSNAMSLPEVVGNAAVLVAPQDVNGLASAIGNLHQDPRRRSELSALGLQRAACFSWERSAKRLLEVAEAALS